MKAFQNFIYICQPIKVVFHLKNVRSITQRQYFISKIFYFKFILQIINYFCELFKSFYKIQIIHMYYNYCKFDLIFY